ncbi:gluconeogenesis factor YvcK family protein [Lapillicoccus jejuensis]|uniref:Putative gluconeogenesis factor n=1 Tax=Lapillicoccus jejuensis TaxID=402171 RepID=A0A542E495_9MICO|nr:uridine diphosphate-N-acetylglucosamine-binding protein YvcK [Lapillicoccus jejuensis]TQJ10109.1 putative cofD-like protein [Lapillicoccus jejuensis]
MTDPRVAALGGGHGLASSLAALKLVTERVTAVVTVADDGGSSGRLRDELGVLPPGDLRMALAALCDDSTWGHTWRDVLQHRFAGEGALAGHALGNLLIVSLWDLLGDTVGGLDLVGRLLNSRGRVLPMAAVPLAIEAEVLGPDGAVHTVHGQHRVATARGQVRAVRLLPEDPECPPETLQAVQDADWVVLGPGSWFTSVLPHVLVPSLREALATTRARKLLNLNLELHTDETKGYRASDHLASLARHAPGLTLDVVLADPSCLGDDGDPRAARAELEAAARELGAELVVSTVSRTSHRGQHDSLRLAAAYRDVFG